MEKKSILRPLNEYERGILLPIIVKCLSKHVGKEKAITNSHMCEALIDNGYDIKEVRMRKIIHYIRDNWLIGCLIASNRGYHVTKDRQEMLDYIDSLRRRVEAIEIIIEAMLEQLAAMPEERQEIS